MTAPDRPKRSLSQNFLVDPNLQRKVAAELEAEEGDLVLEVGPGHGELTRHLVGGGAGLLLVEKDDALAAELEGRWGGRPDVRVVHADALEADLDRLVREAAGGRPVRVLSNVPYGITSPLVFRLLELRPLPARLVLTVQREVAERMAARPGSGDYGALTVGVQSRAEARVAFEVSRQAFRPVPDVESATVVLVPRPDLPAPERLAALRTLTREAFSRRRKQLQKILRSSPEYRLDREAAVAVCRDLGLDPRVRPERVSPERFLALAVRLEEARAGPREE